MSVNDLAGSAQIEFLISCNGIKDDNRKNGMRSELWMLVCKDEVKEAMAGGPIEPLERYGYWYLHGCEKFGSCIKLLVFKIINRCKGESLW